MKDIIKLAAHFEQKTAQSGAIERGRRNRIADELTNARRKLLDIVDNNKDQDLSNSLHDLDNSLNTIFNLVMMK